LIKNEIKLRGDNIRAFCGPTLRTFIKFAKQSAITVIGQGQNPVLHSHAMLFRIECATLFTLFLSLSPYHAASHCANEVAKHYRAILKGIAYNPGHLAEAG